jgi:hypothetical protein
MQGPTPASRWRKVRAASMSQQLPTSPLRLRSNKSRSFSPHISSSPVFLSSHRQTGLDLFCLAPAPFQSDLSTSVSQPPRLPPTTLSSVCCLAPACFAAPRSFHSSTLHFYSFYSIAFYGDGSKTQSISFHDDDDSPASTSLYPLSDFTFMTDVN